ncbi:MAG: hypothetical protein FJX36_17385 [Alphaproteobacteria bacterium]|nr:hypothetical protein [Alphaproteobacteria bacterium]
MAGAIGAANRGAPDAFADPFLCYHEIAFDRAYAFDRAMLEALGIRRITTRYPGTDRAIEAEGPLLRDVLAAVGATGAKVSAMALDGYAAEIAVDEAARYDIVLALRADGHDLKLGGRGPAWIAFPDDPAFAERGDAAWVWGVFFLRVD